MKNRLLILSDLWGKEKANWLVSYTDLLSPFFDITFYDCTDLGDIDTSIYQEEKLHEQFIQKGINTAVDKLKTLETKKVIILAFSIGGTIAWKYALQAKNVNTLYCVSATRLRHELEKPNCNLQLYFGQEDSYKPSQYWFSKMEIKPFLLDNKSHYFYSETDFANLLCDHLIKNT